MQLLVFYVWRNEHLILKQESCEAELSCLTQPKYQPEVLLVEQLAQCFRLRSTDAKKNYLLVNFVMIHSLLPTFL